MGGTSTSGVVAGLLALVRPLVSRDLEAFCSRLDHCNFGSAPVVKATAGGRLDGADGAPSLSKVQYCVTSSAVSCLTLDSGALLPCQTLAILFHNFSTLLIRCPSLSFKVVNIHSSFMLHGVVLCKHYDLPYQFKHLIFYLYQILLLLCPHSTLQPLDGIIETKHFLHNSVTKFEPPA